MKITILLYSGTSTISRLIRWQTRSQYSHAAAILPDGTLIEAREFEGVLSRYPTISRDMEAERFTVEVTDAQAEIIERFLKAQVGKRYDYTMVARFVTRRDEARRTSKKWFCSELVFAAFKKAGVALLRDTEPWEVSPGMLARSPLLTPVGRECYKIR